MTALPLDGQRALVTGASRGIGQAVARRLAADGAVVFAVARSEEALDQLRNELGRSLVPVVCDLANRQAVDETLKPLVAEPFSILVNNAGMIRDGLFIRLKDPDWDEVMELNLTAAFRLTRLVVRGMMKKRYGRIVNVASVVALSGNPGQANYVASKAGLIGFGKALALEVAGRGVTVNSVLPGFIETQMTEALPAAARDAFLARIPLGRPGKAEEVAAAVAFLVSPEAAYITGQNLGISGGL